MKKIAMIVASSLALSVSVEAARTPKKLSSECIQEDFIKDALSELTNMPFIKEQLASKVIAAHRSSNIHIQLSKAQEKAIRKAITNGQFSFKDYPISGNLEGEECIYRIPPQISPILKTPKPFS